MSRDVSRTDQVSALEHDERMTAAARHDRWRWWLQTAAVSTLLASGCQSAPFLSRSAPEAEASTAESDRPALTNRPVEARTASHAGRAPIGAATISQHLQLGEQALAQHGQDPRRLDDARYHFQEVLRTDPSQAVAHHRLGVISDLQRDFTQAERHYAQALRQSPRDAQLLHDVGYSYILQGRHSEAIPYLQESLLLAPGFEMAARKLADAYVQTRQPELARQTLRQILPEDQAQAELVRLQQAHDPAARPSLFGKMRQNLEELRPERRKELDPTAELLADLEKARIEGDRARQQREASRGQGHNAPWAPPGGAASHSGHVPPHQLAGALAQVDRNVRPGAGQPIVIDPDLERRGAPPAHGLASAMTPQAGWDSGPGRSWGGYGDPAPAGIEGQSTTSSAVSMIGAQVPAQAAPGQPSHEALPSGYQLVGGVVTAVAQPQNELYQSPHQPYSAPIGFTPAEMIRGTQRGSTLSQPPRDARSTPPAMVGHNAVMPATGGVLPAGGRFTPGALGDGRAAAPVNNASYQEPGWATPSIAHPQGVRGAASAPPQQGWGASAATATAGSLPVDDYQAAAAMGMGLGPGQMFPMLQQSERLSPGTNSLWNGGQYPQAARQLPTDRPPADLSRAYVDLNQAYQVPGATAWSGAAAALPPNSHGQQMPAASQQWTQPPSAYSGQVWGSHGVSPDAVTTLPPNPLHDYEAQRHQYDAGNNTAIRQAYGNYPSGQMLTPSYGLPIDAPPHPSSQMASWNTTSGQHPNHPAPATTYQASGVVTPEPYPSSPNPSSVPSPQLPGGFRPQVAPLTGAAQLPPANYSADVVVPEPYRGAPGTGRLSGGATPYGGPTAGAGYPGPMILPGR